MKFWKEKNLFPVLSVVFLLGLLVFLAGLQYKWLGQISDAEREHLQSRLQDDTRRFAEDFNREIQSVYLGFQINAEDFKNQNWNNFNESLISWRNQTQFPELIKEFYFVKKDDSETLLKFDIKKSDFEKVEWTNDLTNISQKLNDENGFNPILEKQPALAIPILDKNDDVKQIIIRTQEIDSDNVKTESKMQLPPKYGFLIIFLDENVIKNQIIPTLINKYFSNTENADYKLSIINLENQTVFQTNSENINLPDSTAKIFSLKSNNFTLIRKNNGDISSDSQVKKENTFVYNENFSTKTVTSEKNKVLTINVKNAAEEKPRIAIYEGNGENLDGVWTLNIQHSDGSLEQFITNTRHRNLAVSFGILSLLAASVILIFISAQRSKMLAQRQLDFVSSVSHEFRTPLAVIYSAGENLTDGVVNSPNQISKYGGLIKGEGKKLSAMVEQILDFAGANSGRKKYDRREVDVGEIVENAIAECQPLLTEKNYTLEKSLPKNLPKITADKNALSGAIQNLIVNAVKYGNGNQWLKISAENGAGNIKIIVEDNGIGIDKKEIGKIFEPFYRAKSVVDAQIHGNGLGLSLVKQTVAAHGGKVSAESEIGKGSQFIVHLPLDI